jgi:hypothetical protein
MTGKAITVGLLGAAFIGGFCYFHDCVINHGAVVRVVPHLMPHTVYAGLILAVLLLNPVLGRWRPRWRLTPAELAVAGALCLTACSVPFYGMVHCWPSACMLPHHYVRTTPGWQQEKVLDLAPKVMLADPSCDEAKALPGYVTGLGLSTHRVAVRDIPWAAWARTMRFWVPLVLSITLATLGLALVIHRQWSHHEQLAYPIQRFAHALLTGDAWHAADSVFRHRGFRIAALAVLLIHLNNYACSWWPDYLVPVRLRLDLWPFARLLPEIVDGDGGSLFHPRIIFAVVGIAYLFATDVSFSMALTPVVLCYVFGVLTGYGISVTKGFSLYNNTRIFLYTGGYVGVFLMALYTGRFFYLNVLRRSLGLRTAEVVDSHLAWGLRVFFLGTALFTVQLILVGLDWPLAVLYTATAVMVFTVVSRAVAESGVFWVGTWIMPCSVLWGFLGSRAVGPQALVIMALVSIVVLVGPGWAPMPFAVQALQLGDLCGVKVSKLALWSAVALVLCLAVALPATIYWQYDRGVMVASSGWAQYTPRLPFDQALQMKQQLEAQGLLGTASGVHGLGRFAELKPNGTFWAAFGVGLALTLVVSFCRLRFPWWPLHPIVFILFDTHQAQYVALSFFLGWLVKVSVLKYGGAKAYQTVKPVMIGLIAGEVLAGFLPMAIGVVYYLITHEPPRASYSLTL